jgi:hypothetical protein
MWHSLPLWILEVDDISFRRWQHGINVPDTRH